MNRRSFIKNTALAATMVGIAPSVMASGLKSGKKKKVIFVFRGVSSADVDEAFKKFSPSKSYSFIKVNYKCLNNSYSHTEGMENLISGINEKYQLYPTENMERYQLSQVVPNALNSTLKTTQIIYLHHTEIGHSSNKLYKEKLLEFFTELGKAFDPDLHKIIITADIGRNENINSCGGRDHSNPSSLDNFALYLGGNPKLKSSLKLVSQNQILSYKF